MNTSDVTFNEGLANFSFDLYGAFEKSGNDVLSPFSISAALLFLMLGTDGTTKQQLITAIFKDQTISDVHHSYQTLNYQLTDTTVGGVTLSIANRLFGQYDFNVSESYKVNAPEYYASELELLDIVSLPEQSRQRINSWISTQTNSKIDDIIPRGGMNSKTVMVLANAIYFKGFWEKQFDIKDTRKMNFYVDKNIQKEIDMMSRQGLALSGENLVLDCKILQLPYQGNNLSMLFILPNDGDGLSRLESLLKFDAFATLLSSLKEQDTVINIPKFSIVSSYRLRQVLSSLGITELFDPLTADFRNMVSSGTKVYLSEARHKAFIEVVEEGTEVVTASGKDFKNNALSITSTPFEFNADHPFLFIVRDHQTESIILIGRYSDP